MAPSDWVPKRFGAESRHLEYAVSRRGPQIFVQTPMPDWVAEAIGEPYHSSLLTSDIALRVVRRPASWLVIAASFPHATAAYVWEVVNLEEAKSLAIGLHEGVIASQHEEIAHVQQLRD